jgi:hypothetical protein
VKQSLGSVGSNIFGRQYETHGLSGFHNDFLGGLHNVKQRILATFYNHPMCLVDFSVCTFTIKIADFPSYITPVVEETVFQKSPGLPIKVLIGAEICNVSGLR